MIFNRLTNGEKMLYFIIKDYQSEYYTFKAFNGLFIKKQSDIPEL